MSKNTNFKAVIGTSARKDNFGGNVSMDGLPGPGRYDIKDGFLNSSRIHNNTFGTTQKDSYMKQLLKRQIPGPGSYIDPNEFGKRGPKYTVSKVERTNKILSPRESSTPGPGRYDTERDRSKSHGFKIGSEPKFKADSRNIPGPGQYSPKTSKPPAPGYRFTNSKRASFTRDTYSPGPGRYTTRNGFFDLEENPNKIKGITIRGKMVNRPDNNNPGPGSYSTEVNAIKSKTPSAYFSTSKRDKSIFKEEVSREIPGPGRYNQEMTKTSSGYRFGLDAKLKYDKNLNPGPGQYKIPCSIRDVNDYQTTGGKFDPEFKYV